MSNMLLSPHAIGNVNLKNRIVMPPMCLYNAQDNGFVTPFHTLHYGARALGGVGLIIVEATGVESRGRISDKDLGIWTDEHIPSHESLTKTCKSFGSHIALQLAHAGRKCECINETPVAPSPLAFSPSLPFKTPHELSLDEIEDVKNAFINGAIRAQKSGYDMIELHGAHGYLLCEFLSPLTNQRNDEYGGSFKNRCRLLLEIAKGIKEAVSIPLIVRLSAHEWMREGWSVLDSIKLSQALENLGVDALHISSGGNHLKPDLAPSIIPLYQAGYAKSIKEHVNIPVIAVGLITTPVEAEALLMNKGCDFVAFGRELLRNPNLAYEAASIFKEPSKLHPSYIRAYM
jgi:NADPH2 dehydrogenase